MSAPHPEVVVGQIWHEKDTRFNRFVRVEAVGEEHGFVSIRTVYARSLGFGAERGRMTRCRRQRFVKAFTLERDVEAETGAQP